MAAPLQSTTASGAEAALATYAVRIEGAADDGLRSALEGASGLITLRDRAPVSLRALRRRAEEDRDRLHDVLRSRGYYAGTVTYRIEAADAAQPDVVVTVESGPVYRLGEYRIHSLDPAEPSPAISLPPDTLGFEPGAPAEAALIVRAESALLAALARRAYPLSSVAGRQVVVDHDRRMVDVDLWLEAGPSARFGQTAIEGLETVDPGVIRRAIAWREGAPFDSSLLDETRKRLRETGLFASVQIHQGETVDASSALPIRIVVGERKHRSIGAGASYSTIEGALVKLFWEHRNLFGDGVRLNLRTEAGEIRYGAFGDMRVPDLITRDQDLIVDFRVSEERHDGFRSTETAASSHLERRFARHYSALAGIGIDRSNIEENGVERDFSLLSLPLQLKRDTANDLLDPDRGGRMAASLTPFFGVLGTGVDFVVGRLSDSIYVPLLPDKALIAAGWARVGTIIGARTLEIPANKRLYAGGSGSVRGYGLDSIGPLDAQNDPIGGRSTTEFGAELRWRAFGPVGLVGFIEAGGVYDQPMPDWGEDLRWSAGIGARYYTAIGPLRLDIALPLNRRHAVDDAFAIMISLGQAF